MVGSMGTLLEIVQVRFIDCPIAILVLVADMLSSGGTVMNTVIVSCDYIHIFTLTLNFHCNGIIQCCCVIGRGTCVYTTVCRVFSSSDV